MVHSPTGKTGGVVAAVESLATEAGAQILRAGGNAADAAIATAFAQCVVNPVLAGIAGSFHGLFWDAEAKQAAVISSGGRAPRKSRRDMWQRTGQAGAIWMVAGDVNRLGYQASTIPGFIRGAAEAHSRFGSGRISWADLITPAAALAADGFEVYPYLYRYWLPNTQYMQNSLGGDEAERILHFCEATRRIFLHDDGSVYEIGERLVQTDYAATLLRVAEQGPDEFYEGETARRIADDFAAHDGLLDAEDLRDFRPDITEPVRTAYHEFDVLTETTPSVGPVTLELLNILGGWDLKALGWNTPQYLDRLARAMHVVFRDRLELLGDPDHVEVPLDRILSGEHAAELRRAIEGGTDVRGSARIAAPSEGTTHVSVVDGAHNGAAITHSIGQSSGVVTPGLGFLHNSHMEMFDPVPGSRNGIEPGKRPITGGGPVLFLRDGALHLLIGSPAGALKVTSIVQAFLNMTEFGMGIQEAVSAHRIHAENEPRTVVVEPTFPPAPLLGLAKLGQHIRYEAYSGRLAGVTVSPDGELVGASDPRGDPGVAVVPHGVTAARPTGLRPLSE